MSRRPSPCVDVRGVAAVQVAKRPRKALFVIRRQDDVDVVRHQAISGLRRVTVGYGDVVDGALFGV